MTESPPTPSASWNSAATRWHGKHSTLPIRSKPARGALGGLNGWTTGNDPLRGAVSVGVARFHVHIHPAPFLLPIRIDMSHPIQTHRNPQSLRRLARLFGVDTALRAK